MPSPLLSLAAIRQPAFLYGSDGRVASANDLARALADRPVLGLTPADLFEVFRARPPGGTPLAPAEMPTTRALAGEEAVNVPLEVTSSDGRTLKVLVTASPIREGDRVVGALSIWQDVSGLVRAEEAVRTSEQRLSLAQRAGGVGVFDWDVATGRTVWTPELEKIYGMPSPSDPAQHHDAWIRCVHPDDRERLLDLTREWLASSRAEETWEYRYRRPDGQERWIAGRSIVIRDPENRPLRVIGTNIDITERKRSEAALRESEERFKLALTNAPTVLFAHDRELRYSWVSNPNPAYSGGDVLGKTDSDLFPAEDAERLTALKRRVLKTGTGTRAEVRTTIGGAPYYYDLTLEPLAGERGEVIGVVGVSHDVTERVLAEEALRRRAEELEAVMDLVPAAIWVGHDPACRTITGNRLANEFYEAVPGENVSAGPPPDEEPSPRIFFSPDGRELAADELPMQVAAAQNATVRNAEFEVQLPSGRRRHLLGAAVPLREADGAVRGAVAAFLDITDRKETEEALREYAEDLRRSNEDLERFAYVSSHDLQEPLRLIVSFSQLLERRYRGKLDADADEYIDFIVEGGNRMQALIQDLLAYSRLNTTRQQFAPTDTADVLAGMERGLDLQLREAGATITHDSMPVVMADPIQLEQIFTNLVSNAIKFRRPDEPLRIRIGVRPDDRFWEFSVADNGIGIEKEYFEKIFVIFQRLHTKDTYPGTGIGLAIVKRIVDRHGGRIWIESTPGEGSTFFFTLPTA